MEFKRYYLCIAGIITIIAVVLIIVNPEPHLSFKEFLLYYAIAIFLYALPMSGIYAHMASLCTVDLKADLQSIQGVIEHKTNRVLSGTDDNVYTFSYKPGMLSGDTSFSRWLTNPITVTVVDDSRITLSCPRNYLKYFSDFVMDE